MRYPRHLGLRPFQGLALLVLLVLLVLLAQLAELKAQRK
jgi:hypothetical protein